METMASPSKHRKGALRYFHIPKTLTLMSPLKLLPIDDIRHEMWYELFYDLILVTGVFNLGHLLGGGDDLNFVKFLVVFVYASGLTGTWVNFQEYVNRFNAFDLLTLVFYIAHLVAAMFYVAYLQGPYHDDCPAAGTGTGTDTGHAGTGNGTDTGHHRRLLSAGSDKGHRGAYDLLRDQSGLVFGYAIMQFMLSLKYARVAYVIVEYRQQAICKSLGAFLDSFVWICSLSVSHEPAAIYLYALGMFLDQACQVFALWKFKALPYHVHHFTTRCTLLFLIFVGELVLQLGISPRKHGENTWYKMSLFFIFITIMMFAVQYAFLSNYQHGHHTLDNPKSLKSMLWIKIHQGCSLAVLCAAVGLSHIFQSIAEFDIDGNKERKAILFASGGLCATQIGLTTIRMFNKGCPRHRCYSKRTFFYIWRYFNAFAYLIVWAFFRAEGVAIEFRGQPLLFFILTFVVAFLSTLADLVHPEHLDHHADHDSHEQLEEGVPEVREDVTVHKDVSPELERIEGDSSTSTEMSEVVTL